MSQRGLFYGWVVLAAAATVIAVAMGALFSLSVFLKPIEDAMRWSRSAISLVALINWIAMGAGSFAWGALSDRIGSRVVGPDLPHGDARDRPGRGGNGGGDRLRRLRPVVDRRADRLRPPRGPLRRQAYPRRGPGGPGGDGLLVPLHARGRELLRGRRRLRRRLRRRHAPLRPRPARG